MSMENEVLVMDDLMECKRRLEDEQKVNEVMQHIISEYIKQISESVQDFEIPIEPFLMEEEMERFNREIDQYQNIERIRDEITEIMENQCEFILRCLREYTNMNFEIISSEKIALLIKFEGSKIGIDFKKSYINITTRFS